MTALHHLACARCDAHHDPHVLQSTCVGCGGPLLARYVIDPGRPTLEEVMGRRPGQTRCHETYPTRAGGETATLGEGATPLLEAGAAGGGIGLSNLWIKDEAQNPTLSFKARGMAAAVARAAELGVRTVCLPSAGNAGGAAAAYGARHGLRVIVFIPESTPYPLEAECRDLGAEVTRVPGTIADAGRALAAAAKPDWFSLATLREPYRVEGKKVMGYELLYDLGRLPDVIVYPTGGGTGLIGMWKAFQEMEDLGWIGPERPRMIAVQVAGCAPMVRAFDDGLEHAPPWTDPEPTTAFGLRVPGALGDFLILRAVRQSGGVALAVEEDPMNAAKVHLQRRTGLQVSPEGGACYAAISALRAQGALAADATVVLFNTGHDLKYLTLNPPT